MNERDVLRCFPGFSDRSLRVGDLIMPQHVSCRLNIGVQQAVMLLQELEDRGYLEYKESNGFRVSGWFLTEMGYQLISNEL